MRDRPTGFIERPMSQRAGDWDFVEVRGDRFVSGHGNDDWIVRACGVAAPAGEDVTRIRLRGHGDSRAVLIFRMVGISRDRSAGTCESVEPPIAGRRFVRGNLLT